MDILLHIMILYYILYTYKTKYTCLFLRPVNILAVLSVLMEVLSIMRFIPSSLDGYELSTELPRTAL